MSLIHRRCKRSCRITRSILRPHPQAGTDSIDNGDHMRSLSATPRGIPLSQSLGGVAAAVSQAFHTGVWILIEMVDTRRLTSGAAPGAEGAKAGRV